MSDFLLQIPLDKEKDFQSDKHIEKLISGTKDKGLIIGITSSKLVLNGYYTDASTNKKYKCLSIGVEISWDEIKKLQTKLKNYGKKKLKIIKKEFIDNSYTKEYLQMLPIVTINNKKFYIDTKKRERRLVTRPKIVSIF